jgi:hypothetical protein
MRAECQAIVDELRDTLKAGELSQTAVTKAFMKFTALIPQLGRLTKKVGRRHRRC